MQYILPFYRNAGMLRAQLNTWASYSADVLAAFEFIIVDDGSPDSAVDVVRDAPIPVRQRIKVYRVAVDIPWNQHGARNLGAHVADDGWFLMADIDHQLMAEDARQLTLAKLDPTRFYYLRRIKAGHVLETEKPHCNSFVVTRAAFLASGGYDEDFCGGYGGDGQLIAALKLDLRPATLATVSLVRYPREVIPDASTTTYDRDGPLRARYLATVARKPHKPYRALNPVRFAWERVL